MITKEKVKFKRKVNKYPYITRNSKILNGIPIIKGTRISIRSIAGYYQLGMTVDEILSSLQHLSPSEVHSALAYYFDHKYEIDMDIIENSDIYYWKERVSKTKS